MAGFFESFNRGLKGDYEYEIAGKKVVCPHCGGVTFDEGVAQLNTRGATFVGLDWANQNAECLVCKTCGHIEWFMKV